MPHRISLFVGAALLAIAGAGVPASAQAESLRCHGHSSSKGDSRLQVLQRCGEPMLRDSFCKRVEVIVPGYPYPQVLPPHIAPCQWVEEWMYDRGPGNLLVTVRFQNGVVDHIRYHGKSD